MTCPFAILFASALSASAVSYYVDFSAGSDSAAGTTSGTAWQHSPGDANATGNPAATTLQSGDTVYFKGGVSYVTAAITPVSGVTYDGNSAGNWGTGKAVLTDNHANPGGYAFHATALTNATFRSFRLTAFGGSATLPPDLGSPVAPNAGYGMVFETAAYGVTIRDCDFSELGYYFNAKPMDAGAVSGFGVVLRGGFGAVTVSNCAFSRIGTACVSVQPSTLGRDVTVDSCSFVESLRWGVDLSAVALNAVLSNVLVRACTFRDYWQFDGANWTGYGDGPHTDGIFLRDVDYAGVSYTNIVFANNYFATTNGSGGTAALYVSDGPSCDIVGNVFNSPVKSSGMVYLVGNAAKFPGQLVRVLNNSFLGSYENALNVAKSGSAFPGRLLVLNNAFEDLDPNPNSQITYHAWDPAGRYPTEYWDFNCYFPANAGHYLLNTPGPSYTLATARSGLQWETNGMYANPLFVNVAGTGLNTPANDFRLQDASPCRGAGTNLTAWAITALGTDRVGNPRPSLGAWDMGAYQSTTWALTLTGPWTLTGAGWRIGQ